jgi:hypothetical protein
MTTAAMGTDTPRRWRVQKSEHSVTEDIDR